MRWTPWSPRLIQAGIVNIQVNPVIHVYRGKTKDVDVRHEAGHDGLGMIEAYPVPLRLAEMADDLVLPPESDRRRIDLLGPHSWRKVHRRWIEVDMVDLAVP